jgi:hypothetical protein
MVAYRARKAKYEEVQVSIIVRDRNLWTPQETTSKKETYNPLA